MISEIMTETEPFHSELSPNTPGHFIYFWAPFLSKFVAYYQVLLVLLKHS